MAANTSLTSFQSTLEKYDMNSFASDKDRRSALQQARKLVTRLEKPWDTLGYQTWVVPSTMVSCRIGQKMGLFEAMEKDPDTPKTADQLAQATGADKTLICRILMHLTAENLADQVAPNTWKQSAFTHAMTERTTGICAINFLYNMTWPVFQKMPDFLEETKWENPITVTDGPWQYATDSKGSNVFEWFHAHPKEHQEFNELMAGYSGSRDSWVDIYSTEDLFKDAKDDDIILCDVGGNLGSDIKAFVQKHPEAKGRVILQDQESVIKNAVVPNGIQTMAHNFFNPQPVKGARAYFMHSILHDWSDTESLDILDKLKPAFVPGKTRLLLNEVVIPTNDPNPLGTANDLVMMGCCAAWERTEEMFHNLLGKAGFEILKIHPAGAGSVIEAVLK